MIIDRRNILTAAAILPLLSVAMRTEAAETAPASKLDLSGITTIRQFAAQVITRADLSRAASEVAVKKAVRADAREFAGFELMEANTVIAVLKELGTAVPAMAPPTEATLAMIVDAAEGAAFDKAYIGAECENHAFLRDLAAAYLKNSDANTVDIGERHGRQLATVAFWAFTEHTAITHRIAQQLAG